MGNFMGRVCCKSWLLLNSNAYSRELGCLLCRHFGRPSDYSHDICRGHIRAAILPAGVGITPPSAQWISSNDDRRSL